MDINFGSAGAMEMAMAAKQMILHDFHQIDNEARDALELLEAIEVGGQGQDDGIDPDKEQVEIARNIQNLSKGILRYLKAYESAPASNFDHQNAPAQFPQDLFRSIWEKTWYAITAIIRAGDLSTAARHARTILREARSVEQWHLVRGTVEMQEVADDDSENFTEMTGSRTAALQDATTWVDSSQESGSQVDGTELEMIEENGADDEGLLQQILRKLADLDKPNVSLFFIGFFCDYPESAEEIFTPQMLRTFELTEYMLLLYEWLRSRQTRGPSGGQKSTATVTVDAERVREIVEFWREKNPKDLLGKDASLALQYFIEDFS